MRSPAALAAASMSAAASRASTPSSTSRRASSTKRLDHLALGHHPHDLAFDEEVPFPAAAGNADVGLPRLPGTVDDTSHDRYLDVEPFGLEAGLRLPGEGDDVDLGPTARGAGDEVEAFPLPQPEDLEQLTSRLGLFDGVGGEREPDRVADALEEEGADPRDGLDEPGRGRARLRHAEVKRDTRPARRGAGTPPPSTGRSSASPRS